MKAQLEELRKDDKETLVQENKQLKEENTTTETGFGTVEFAPTISLMIETRATTNLPETVIPDAGDFWLLLKGKPGTETESFSAEYEKFRTYGKQPARDGEGTR